MKSVQVEPDHLSKNYIHYRINKAVRFLISVDNKCRKATMRSRRTDETSDGQTDRMAGKALARLPAYVVTTS